MLGVLDESCDVWPTSRNRSVVVRHKGGFSLAKRKHNTHAICHHAVARRTDSKHCVMYGQTQDSKYGNTTATMFLRVPIVKHIKITSFALQAGHGQTDARQEAF